MQLFMRQASEAQGFSAMGLVAVNKELGLTVSKNIATHSFMCLHLLFFAM